MKRTTPNQIQQFVDQLREGKESGLLFFFKQYQKALCFYAFKLVKNEAQAAEIVEDSFVLLWQNRAGFFESQAIISYLYSCTRNLALYQIRKNKKERKAESELQYLYDDVEKDAHQLIIETETYRQILDCMDKLPRQCRKIFHMHFIEGKDFTTIAHQLQLSESTIRNQKARAIRLIRKNLSFFFSFILILIK